MGTQQILLVILATLIIGVAAGVGLTIFAEQAYGANKSALAADSQLYAAWTLQYYRTSKSNGGMGETIDDSSAVDIIRYLGGEDESIVTSNGSFIVEIPETDEGFIYLIGIGSVSRKGKNPKVITSIELGSGTIRSEVSDE